MMNTFILIVLILVVGYIILEAFNVLFSGWFFIAWVYRKIRSSVRGSQYVRIPEGLKTAINNGVIQAGSEVVVGNEHERNGLELSRFSISPKIVKQESGAKMVVDSIGKNFIELRVLK